jgi:hypothetical protein
VVETTTLPAPWRRCTMPCSTSRRSASRTVNRLALNSSHSSLSVGSRMSTGYLPACMRRLSVL